MNAQHFKELINTVSKTTGCTKLKLSSLIGVSVMTISVWERKGVPVRIKPYVISVLRQALLDYMHGGLKYAGNNR
jgi:hypothetical protein